MREKYNFHPSIDENSQPLTAEEARGIKNPGEFIFAVAVTALPHLIVFHEPFLMRAYDAQGTKPDFYVYNSKYGENSKGILIEVTKTGDIGSSTKRRQRRVVRKCRFAGETVPYIQFNGQVLVNIQKKLIEDGLIDREYIDPDTVNHSQVVVKKA